MLIDYRNKKKYQCYIVNILSITVVMEKKLMKFLLFGLITYWVNLGVTFLCSHSFKLDFSTSYFIALAVSVIISFLLSLKVIFKAEFSYRTLVLYLVILLLVAGINYELVNFFSMLYNDIWKYVIIIIATTIWAVVKFFLYDKFVFTEQW